MFRTLLLKYYFVWFQGHKRSKYAHQFSHHWYRGFLQVAVTLTILLATFQVIIERTLGISLVGRFSKLELLILYMVIPSLILYYLLFHYYGLDKNNDDPSSFDIIITKRTRIIAWVIYAGTFVLFGLVLEFFLK